MKKCKSQFAKVIALTMIYIDISKDAVVVENIIKMRNS